MNDRFSRLKAIQSNQNTHSDSVQKPRFWDFKIDGDILGTIVEFNSFINHQIGEQQQHTVVVRLADSDELVSAFLNAYLQVGMERKQAAVGDLVLIQYLGKRPGERFNRYVLEIEKFYPEMF